MNIACLWLRMGGTLALFESDNLDDVIVLKENLRMRYQNDKHSIHITDNVAETLGIANVVFDAEELRKWNKAHRSISVRLRENMFEKWFVFKNMTLINIKVAVAKKLNKIVQR